MTTDEQNVQAAASSDDGAADARPSWIKPDVAVIDIRETQTGGLGNNDGAASHT